MRVTLMMIFLLGRLLSFKTVSFINTTIDRHRRRISSCGGDAANTSLVSVIPEK